MVFSRIFGRRRQRQEPNTPGHDDLLLMWMSTELKLQAIAAEVIELAAESIPAITFCHFEETFEQVTHGFDADGVGWLPLTDPAELSVPGFALPPAVKTLVARAADLPESDPPQPLPDEGPIIHFALAEVHPLREMDLRVLRFAASLPVRTMVHQHAAVDEPTLKLLGGGTQTTMQLMQRMGMTEVEHVQHPMLTRAVRTAQQNLAARATGNEPAESVEQWAKRNLPADLPPGQAQDG